MALAGLATPIFLAGCDNAIAIPSPELQAKSAVKTEEAPDFDLPDTSGLVTRLSQIGQGSKALVFFCGCDRCHRAAVEIARRQKGKKLRNLVAVCAMDRSSVSKFRHETGIQGTLLLDDQEKAAKAYDATMCPRFFAVRDGHQLLYRSGSALEGKALGSSLDKLATLVDP